MALTFILGTAILGLIIYFLFQWFEKRTGDAFARRNVRYIPQNNPIVSLLKKERTELTEHETIKREGLKVFGFTMLNSYTILVADPSIAGLVLSKEFTSFTNRRNIKFDDDIFGSVLSNAMDDQWKRLRSIVTPTFSAGSLKRMKPRIDETVHSLLDNFQKAIKEQGTTFDVKRLYGAFTMDTIIQVAFGTKVDSLAEPNNPILVHARKVFANDMGIKTFATIFMVLLFPKISKFFGIRFQKQALEFFTIFSEQIIERKKEELKTKRNLGKANSFLELVLEAEAEQNNSKVNGQQNGNQTGQSESEFKKAVKFMSTNEMVAQCVLFFLAGYDTTATTITLASYLLALHPDAQKKLYQEIKSVIEKLGKESDDPTKDPVELITIDTLPRFEYLTGVVNETLRLYAPASMTERAASKDIALESEDGSIRIDVKKDDVVHFPIYAMHRDPEQWPEPEQFKPERFIGEPTFHKYSYLPFGSGPRNCVAKSLALLEAKLALLHTMRMFKFSRCEQTKVPIFGSVLSAAMDDQWKRLRSIVTPTFSAGSLKRMKPRIDETVHSLLDNFQKTIKEQGSTIDVKRLYGAFTMDTIIQVAFGTKVNSLGEPDNPILVHARTVSLKILT